MKKSLYGKMHARNFPVIYTVGELKKLLAELPDKLPLNGDAGLKPQWFNVGEKGSGINGEHLYFGDEDCIGYGSDEW